MRKKSGTLKSNAELTAPRYITYYFQRRRNMAVVDLTRLGLLHLLQAFLLGAGIVMVALLVAAVMLGTDRAPTPLAAEVFKY
jgi:hypothetical protein